MKDMTCSFAAAWVRETQAARNADQPTTPWAFRARGVRSGKRVDPAARRLVHMRDQREVFSSCPQFNARVRGWQGRSDARQVSTATPSHGRRACAERTDRIGVRPDDTLPGGVSSLKPNRTDRVENTLQGRRLSMAFTEARAKQVRAMRPARLLLRQRWEVPLPQPHRPEPRSSLRHQATALRRWNRSNC